MIELSVKAKDALRAGVIKLNVVRSGMHQQLTFKVRRTSLGNLTYTELFTERLIDVSELSRLANELGLPVEAQNGRAFPKGTSAADFSSL